MEKQGSRMKGLLKFIGTLGLLYGVSSGMAARAQETGAREDTTPGRTTQAAVR